jgi:hypothetical protein
MGMCVSLTRRVVQVEQELLTFPEHLCSSPDFVAMCRESTVVVLKNTSICVIGTNLTNNYIERSTCWPREIRGLILVWGSGSCNWRSNDDIFLIMNTMSHCRCWGFWLRNVEQQQQHQFFRRTGWWSRYVPFFVWCLKEFRYERLSNITLRHELK